MSELPTTEHKRKLILLKLNAVRARTKLSVPSIYRLIKEGKFPKPINMGERAVAWIEDEIEEWLLAKLEERGDAFQKKENLTPELTQAKPANPLLVRREHVARENV